MKDTNVPNIERAIKKVWTPVKRRVSPVHTVAPILEPGNWKDFDPFFAHDGRSVWPRGI